MGAATIHHDESEICNKLVCIKGGGFDSRKIILEILLRILFAFLLYFLFKSLPDSNPIHTSTMVHTNFRFLALALAAVFTQRQFFQSRILKNI
jgi:hypothetical protein